MQTFNNHEIKNENIILRKFSLMVLNIPKKFRYEHKQHETLIPAYDKIMKI